MSLVIRPSFKYEIIVLLPKSFACFANEAAGSIPIALNPIALHASIKEPSLLPISSIFTFSLFGCLVNKELAYSSKAFFRPGVTLEL